MATSTGQRIGIWVIAIAMTLGTLVGFIAMILAPQNQANDADKQQKAYNRYQQESLAYQQETAAQEAQVKARTAALSKQYFGTFSKFQSQVKKFTAKDVKKVVATDLIAGKGQKIGEDSSYLAYYIGFTPDGKVFDGSIDKKSLKAPLIVRPGGVIAGWTEGLKQKMIGGVYKIVIPSDKAYGDKGQGDSIKPNTPLTFIVMPIEAVKTIKQPEIPKELLSL